MACLRQVCDEYEDRVLLGETEDVSYYGNGGNMLHSVFNFDVMSLERLDPVAIRKVIDDRWPQLPPGAWESNTVGNHDRPRSMSVYADGQPGDRQDPYPRRNKRYRL